MSELLKREKMARALFEVGAPPHQFWDDVGLDKRELYLCMADAALSQGAGDHAPAARTSRWRYEIQDEPEGEFKNAEFAQVFDDKGASVGTLKLHHAFLIVGSINNDELVKIETPPIPPILQREWMAQALFEVDAPDHLEWEDVGIDKRERYLCLADAAIRRNNTCP